MSDEVYRRLQQKLDTHPVGFPGATDDSDIKLLKHIFTPEQAEIVSRLDWRFQTVEEILPQVSDLVGSTEELSAKLHEILTNGGILFRLDNGGSWAIAPLVIGMYEFQVDRLTKGFLADMEAYGKSQKRSTPPPPRPGQLRVIPIQKSITPELNVAVYEEIVALVDEAGESIALLECICRKARRLGGHECERTERLESCMAFLDFAEHTIEQGTARRITRDEALEALETSQREGLVLMPSNSKEPQFVCSCCSDCCGVLWGLKHSKRPADAAESNYRASVVAETCTACGSCEEMCPMEAIATDAGTAVVDENRCIGCGVCVLQCETDSISLVRKPEVRTPPDTFDDLYKLYDATR